MDWKTMLAYKTRMPLSFVQATLLVILLPPFLLAQPTDAIHEYHQTNHVPGMSVAVLEGGTIIYSEGFGFANLEHGVAVSRRTKFRIGSISKTLTSVALAQLWEMGKLDLDASVQRYAPTFPKKRYPITPRLLAGHLSGLPHYNEDDFVNTVHYESVTDALRKFRDRSLLFEPGAQFSYSSFGWNLLSVVVEEAAGEDFLTYMQARVFQPLEMTDTVADRYAQIIEHRTDFYNVTEDGDSFNAVAIDNSDVWAGGGYLSTSEDLVRFADGVLHGGLLEPQTVELLLSPMKTSAGKTTDYGLGWRVWDVEGHRAVGHGGGHIGATAILMALPESGLSVAILTNTGRLELKPLAELILRYYLER